MLLYKRLHKKKAWGLITGRSVAKLRFKIVVALDLEQGWQGTERQYNRRRNIEKEKIKENPYRQSLFNAVNPCSLCRDIVLLVLVVLV